MNRNTKEMKLHDRIDAIPTDIKNNLVNAFRNGDADLILDAANELGTTDKTIRNHIWKWIQVFKTKDITNMLNDLPKDLSFSERLDLALKLEGIRY